MENYEKLVCVGRGFSGIVYLCEDLVHGGRVIIKQIAVDNLTAMERQAAVGEVKMLEMLHHPNIIGYIDHFIDEDAICIVMEYAQGGTLAGFLKDRRGCLLDEQEVLALFSQIVLSLHYLHSRQILHRDLKANNILLNKQHSICMLSDFGISKVLLCKTKTETVIGTPAYFSPELCEGKEYCQKNDIWAIGCILYELVSLRRAFDAESLPALVLKIMRGKYAPIPEQYSEQLRKLIDSLLHLDPAKRPSTVQLLANPLLIAPVFSALTDLGAIVCSVERPFQTDTLSVGNSVHAVQARSTTSLVD